MKFVAPKVQFVLNFTSMTVQDLGELKECDLEGDNVNPKLRVVQRRKLARLMVHVRAQV